MHFHILVYVEGALQAAFVLQHPFVEWKSLKMTSFLLVFISQIMRMSFLSLKYALIRQNTFFYDLL